MENSPPKTLVELLKQATAAQPQKEVLRFKQDKQWTGITGQELFERVRRVTLGLYDFGIRKWDRVAVLAESGPQWSITDYAILSTGAINVPIYPTQPVEQVEYILRESQPKLLFVSNAKQLKRVADALQKFPDLHIIPFQDISNGENLTSYASLEARGAQLLLDKPGLFEAISTDVKPADLASIIYTSGTTGEPKGALLSHANIVSNAMAAGAVFELEPDNQILSFLPLSHIFERMVLYLCLYFGVQINYSGGIETVANDLKEVHPTLMTTVPRLLEKVFARMQKTAADKGGLSKKMFDWSLEVARQSSDYLAERKSLPLTLSVKRKVADKLVFGKLREALGGKMMRVVSGGAALPVDIARVFIGAGIPVLQGYGLTETSPVIAVNSIKQNRIGAVGRPLPGVEVKLAEDGEILARGAAIFQGYFNKVAETASVFTEEAEGERWFKTGDIGKLDKNGFLYITDRKKDLIKTSAGKYVAPQMLEGMISQSPFVEQVIIIGDKRKYVAALIVPEFEQLRSWAKDQGLDASDKSQLIADKRVVDLLKQEVNRLTKGLADYEKVKRIALLPKEFTIDGGELTATLKVRRRVVEEKYQALIESLYPTGAE
ncbi:MAG: long-chain fatty acid--CoA ligase [Acidobacteria bacterium]|nr:long-chain fatty acid--CoA ligase [Acidobacteriota bacterium]